MSNITTPDFCFSAQRPRSINDRINIPFYIYAPNYRDSSGGIRILHYLCHILNEIGEEAYLINTQIASPRLRTPLLTFSKIKQHFLAGQNPVTIYPEIISNNPINTPLIVRWLLNIPGHLGDPIEFEPRDIIYYYEAWCVPKGLTGDPLFIHPVDHTFFNNKNNPDDKNRTHECFYACKYHLGNEPINKEHENLLSLGQEIKRSHEEIAAILRKSRVLYCYEPSGIISEAQACGCPVILVRSNYWPLGPEDTHHKIPGTAIYGEDNALERAQESLTLIPNVHASARDNSWRMTKQLVEKIYSALNDLAENGKPLINEMQELWALDAADRKNSLDIFTEICLGSDVYFKDVPPFTRSRYTLHQSKFGTHSSSGGSYQKWLEIRQQLQESQIFENFIPQENALSPIFHVLLRLDYGQESALANTIDSLGGQVLGDWQLDVFAPQATPEGLEDIPCIHWQTLSASDTVEEIILQRINKIESDWIIEIPAGVKLDPLYLSRIATAATEHPATKAFFVDDDCYNDDGSRTSPRFKPGCNPSALLSSDMTGVLCIQRHAWHALNEDGSPADSSFAQLLGISEKFGWNAITHIPDSLLSYPDTFRSNNAECKTLLKNHLGQRGIEAEILHTGKQSWCVRRPLINEPKVTISIISDGKYELLSRCLESLCTLTQYKSFEILVSLKSDNASPDILKLLREQEEKSGLSIQTNISPVNSTFANCCNSAVDRIKSEFIVFLREEAQVIQETWLGELVRTATEENVAAVMPRLITPGSAKIENIGYVLGMNGVRGLPYQDSATIKEEGYLDYIQMPRDISLLPNACYLIKKQSYMRAGGMDETNFPDHWAEADLSMKLRKNGERLICQPLSNVVFQITDQYDLPPTADEIARSVLNKKNQENAFIQRWWPNAAVDPFWNPNLSLRENIPTPETRYLADWQISPRKLPRILARSIMNGEGYYRVSSPLKALQQKGIVQECIWNQLNGEHSFTPAEVIRLAPDTLIVQNYMSDERIQSLAQLHAVPDRPFMVFALGDLAEGLAESNPMKITVPPNPKARLKFAFAHCDRLVVTTDYLANAYQHLISDIKVVPNCLEQAVWLPLHSRKRTAEKPRIGWAGGVTHQDDLLLLQEIIEQTRDEADWVFMGMCPDELRPLLSEFHGIVSMDEYPAYLASLNLDIAVAPLADIPFNRAKSNLRLLEYGILGIPVVCTDIDPYRDSPACCVTNTTESWVAALRERIHDPDAREREGITMRRWVQQKYLLENNLDEWLNAHLPG
jgi:O-antigen biosynthesis protein